ncbi:MAG: hypothetical protein LBQ27_02750 [Clostridiales bacterium]|jgi:hypothetical protein|nr:hypothetical protein [Clostridiales bacterium]
MFYRKETPSQQKKIQTVRIPLVLGSIGSAAYDAAKRVYNGEEVERIYNYRPERGALKTGIGLSKAKMLPLGGGVEFEIPAWTKALEELFIYTRYDTAADSPDDRLVGHDEEGYFYETKLYESSSYTRIVLPRTYEKADLLNYRYNGSDVLLISIEAGLYIYDGIGNASMISQAPKVCSMCSYRGRVYAALRGDKTRGWYSDTYNPTSWSASAGGGYYDFFDEGGYVRKVVQFKDGVYIFRDFSVEKLKDEGGGEGISLTKVCTLSARLIPDTVLHCGNAVVYMQRDGLYSFDGAKVKKIFENVIGITDMSGSPKACYDRNKYYVAARLDFGDGEAVLCETTGAKRNVLFEFDLNAETVNTVRGISVNDMAGIKTLTAEKVFLCLSHEYDINHKGVVFELDKSGRIMSGATLPALFSSAYSTLGKPEKKKLIRRISFVTKHDVTLRIKVDGRVFDYAVKGGEVPVRVYIGRQCDVFSFSFLGGGQAEISDVSVEMQYQESS